MEFGGVKIFRIKINYSYIIRLGNEHWTKLLA
uniref:Uncharacterized protein n=1 Tax=Octopus bimaculoides TaxID=37653 RepID=A0A0L8G763_OCTBM